jgi:soluble lytic murein transglycosylase-like protein
MNRSLLWLVLGGAVVAYLALNRQKVYSIVQDTTDTISSAVAGWKSTNQGPTWIPILDSIGRSYNLPPDLLARVAYQESHFREDIIRGTTASSAGALGIMQMLPQFFSSVTTPRPFNDTDVRAQILEAASYLAQLYRQYRSWPMVLAAYNAGPGNVNKYQGIPPFPETQAYVAEIRADVPNLV